MVSRFLNRNVIGILVITLIFGVLSAITLYRMYGNLENNGGAEVSKNDYILMLEEYLEIPLDDENDFENLSKIGYDLVIEPTQYKNHYKPCFDFVITDSGVVIKNAISKEFYDYNFKTGMKITHINSTELKGKGYFEILDLLYSSSKESKTFTIDGEEIEYSYVSINDRIYYDEKDNRLYVYNLDKITQKAIHDYYLENPDLTIDLSMATVNTLNGMYEFISLFVSKDVMLFITPQNVYAKDNRRKISSIKIDLGNNPDKGILFTATTINKLNSNVFISQFQEVNTFFATEKLVTEKYTIYIKNGKIQNKVIESPGEII